MSQVDLQIATSAAARHGVFTTEDVLATGATHSLITRRVQAGRWVRIAPGVYVVAGAPESWERAVSAAILRLGPLAAASHRTAAHLHGLYGRPRRIEVVTRATGARGLPFVVHQCQDITVAEIVPVRGIATTDVARTIIDVGVPAGIQVTQRILDDALRKGLVNLHQVAARIHRYGRKGRRGIGPARALVIERLGWNDLTESVLEDALLRLAKRSGLPTPTPQRRVRLPNRVARVDFDFGRSVVVELDSEKFHMDPTRFRDDRRRHNALTHHGLTVLRFTWWDVMADPEYVASTIATALANRI